MNESSLKRIFKGVVISNKMDKTLVVKLDKRVKHKLYKKFIIRSTKVYVHDENNEALNGDIVCVKEIASKSKMKSFLLLKIIK